MGTQLLEVPGWPAYAVEQSGAVWSCLAPGTRGQRRGPWRQLKPAVRKGYLCVHLCDGRKRRRLAGVHQLVLEVFVGPCPAGMEGHHLDGDPLNNQISNLAWGTKAENMQDAIRHGNHYFSVSDHRGEANGNSRLSEADVLEIRALAATLPRPVLAARFKIAKRYVDQILRREVWRHI